MKVYNISASDARGYHSHLLVEEPAYLKDETVSIEKASGEMQKIPTCVFRIARVYVNIARDKMRIQEYGRGYIIYAYGDDYNRVDEFSYGSIYFDKEPLNIDCEAE